MINLNEANKKIIEPRNEIERKVANIFKKVFFNVLMFEEIFDII